jgi:hypothetical protein
MSPFACGRRAWGTRPLMRFQAGVAVTGFRRSLPNGLGRDRGAPRRARPADLHRRSNRRPKLRSFKKCLHIMDFTTTLGRARRSWHYCRATAVATVRAALKPTEAGARQPVSEVRQQRSAAARCGR